MITRLSRETSPSPGTLTIRRMLGDLPGVRVPVIADDVHVQERLQQRYAGTRAAPVGRLSGAKKENKSGNDWQWAREVRVVRR
jgi:hypothetical protein